MPTCVGQRLFLAVRQGSYICESEFGGSITTGGSLSRACGIGSHCSDCEPDVLDGQEIGRGYSLIYAFDDRPCSASRGICTERGAYIVGNIFAS